MKTWIFARRDQGLYAQVFALTYRRHLSGWDRLWDEKKLLPAAMRSGTLLHALCGTRRRANSEAWRPYNAVSAEIKFSPYRRSLRVRSLAEIVCVRCHPVCNSANGRFLTARQLPAVPWNFLMQTAALFDRYIFFVFWRHGGRYVAITVSYREESRM